MPPEPTAPKVTWYVLTEGRGIPYDMGGGRERVPIRLEAKTYADAVVEADCRCGKDNYIRLYSEPW